MNMRLICMSLLLLFMACKGKKNDVEANAKKNFLSDSTMKLLRMDTVKCLPLYHELKLTGEVNFDENKVVRIFPFSSGQIVRVNVSVGDHVHAGQVLATIRSAEIASSYSDLAMAENEVNINRKNMENAQHLYQNGITSEREYLEANENYKKSLSSVERIKSQIRINGSGNTTADGTYQITSPRSGYVIDKLVNPGDFIRSDNTNNLFTIGDMQDVWIWANVFEADIARIHANDPADITTMAYPDKHFIGKVDKMSTVLDPVTKVMKVKIILPNEGGLLKPEMFANVVIKSVQQNNCVSVPSSAIISENGKNYVVVFKDQSNVSIREVNIMSTNEEETYISSGLQIGEQVITKNQILVYQKIKENI